MTAEELLRMPDDGFRYELVRGELRQTTPAGYKHGRIVLNISTPLDQHVRANKLGAVFAAETGFKLESGPDLVRAPDVRLRPPGTNRATGRFGRVFGLRRA